MVKQDWHNTSCPWNCPECRKREEQRDLAVVVKPFYTEYIKPLKGQVVEMRLGPFERDVSGAMGACAWVEKTSFSSTKTKPSPVLTLFVSRGVRLRDKEYIDYGDEPVKYVYSLLSGELDGGWLKMEVRDVERGSYSSECLWLRLWNLDLEIMPCMGWKCPECGTFIAERSCFVYSSEEEGGEVVQQFWCNCGFKIPLAKMLGKEVLQEIPQDLKEYVIVNPEMGQL